MSEALKKDFIGFIERVYRADDRVPTPQFCDDFISQVRGFKATNGELEEARLALLDRRYPNMGEIIREVRHSVLRRQASEWERAKRREREMLDPGAPKEARFTTRVILEVLLPRMSRSERVERFEKICDELGLQERKPRFPEYWVTCEEGSDDARTRNS